MTRARDVHYAICIINRLYILEFIQTYRYFMKKTVVVDIEYMRPSAGGRSRSRSRSRSQTRSRSSSVNRIISNAIESTALCDGYEYDDDDLNIAELLQKDKPDIAYDDTDTDTDTDTDKHADEYRSSSASSGMTEQSDDDDAPRRHPSVKDTDYAVNSDDDLFQSVLDEPTFPLDVNAILSAMTKTENSTIANMTVNKIAARRHEILSSLNLPPEKMEEFERKLHMYRVIENPYELKHNQLIRWIPLRSLETRPYVTLGGCLFKIKYNDEESIHVVTMRNVKRFVFNIKFELNVVFQRLSQEELLILRAVEYIESDDIIIQQSSGSS